jgi:hypothetical protein
MIARKDRTPWTTPYRLTPTVRSHASIGPVHALPIPAIPALLHNTCAPPNRSRANCARVQHVLQAGSVTAPRGHVGAPGGEQGPHLFEPDLVDVGHHDLHPLGHEPLGERQPDTDGPARDDGDLVSQIFHGSERTSEILQMPCREIRRGIEPRARHRFTRLHQVSWNLHAEIKATGPAAGMISCRYLLGPGR